MNCARTVLYVAAKLCLRRGLLVPAMFSFATARVCVFVCMCVCVCVCVYVCVCVCE